MVVNDKKRKGNLSNATRDILLSKHEMIDTDIPGTTQHFWLSDADIFARFTSGIYRKGNTASTVCLHNLYPK